jgi:hypothetical protein
LIRFTKFEFANVGRERHRSPLRCRYCLPTIRVPQNPGCLGWS